MRFRVKNYHQVYANNTDRAVRLEFCPSKGAAKGAWAMAGNISLTSTSGEKLEIVSLSQYFDSIPGMVDSEAERGVPVETYGCDQPQGWAVYFSDEARSTQPALSSIQLTSDGQTVSFGPDEIPVFYLKN